MHHNLTGGMTDTSLEHTLIAIANTKYMDSSGQQGKGVEYLAEYC